MAEAFLRADTALALVDADGRVRRANGAAARLLGRDDPDDLVGRAVADLVHYPEPAPGEAPEGAAPAAAGAAQPCPAAERAQFFGSDGSVTWLRLRHRPIDRDALPDACGASVLVLEDVTDRRRDELLLQETFEARPQPFVMVDREGRVQAANRAWRASFESLLHAVEARRDAPGVPLAALLDEEGAVAVASALAETARGDRSFFEVGGLTSPAEARPRALRLRGVALHDLAGRPERVLVEFDDLTEHALEVSLARENARRARSTIDLIDEAVVTHDADGRAAEVSLGAHRVFGAGASDLVGQRSVPAWWRPLRTDSTPLPERQHPAALVLEGAPSASTVLQLTLPGGPPRWFAVHARPVDESTATAVGARGGAIVTYRELTSHMADLAASRAETAELAELIDALPLACYAADPGLVPSHTNEAWRRLVGDVAEPCEHPLADLLGLAHPEDRQALGAAVDRAVKGGAPTELFHRLRTADGRDRWVHHHLAPRPCAGGAAGAGGVVGGLVGGAVGAAGVVGIIFEVPEFVALAERTGRLLNLVETTNDLVGEYDVGAGRLTYLNPRARELFQGGQRALAEVDFGGMFDPEVDQIFRDEVWPELSRVGRWEGELPMITVDGRRILVQQWMTAERGPEGELIRLLSAGHDVTDRSTREAELALRATHDRLTGLANRTLLLDHLELALGRARRTGQLVALVLLDLDRFKSANDRLGHELGDALLAQVGARLAATARDGDTVARLGGDEFVTICDGVDDKAHALDIAQRIAAAVSGQVYDLEGVSLRATASMGLALSAGDDHPEALLRDADAAMYRAKELGRARLEVFDERMRTTASNRVQLAEELRHALASGEITVHYQPSIDLRTGGVSSVESLARWRHPERGLLAPAAFIEVADSTGLVLELGLEVLRQACRKSRQWRQRWGAATPRTHVNLSVRQVADPELPRRVAEILAETGADPAGICLEITESILLEDSDSAISAIAALKDLGVSLAIDDFGTGYSSLSYLSRLPVDVVKIDKSFIDRLDPIGGDGAVVAAAIISLARTLRLATIAEGVTTVVQLAELHRLGCDAAQGFYFSPPLDGERIDRYLAHTLGP